MHFQRADFGLFRTLSESQGESPEGQRGPARLDILQGGSLKGTGAGCPHVSQDKSMENMTDLVDQGALAGTQEKKESLSLMEERADDSRGVQGL